MLSKPATRIPEDRLAEALGEKLGDRQVTATDADQSGLRALPKADVHCHALLNCPLSTYEHVLGYKLPSPPARFRDFREHSRFKRHSSLTESHQQMSDNGRSVNYTARHPSTQLTDARAHHPDGSLLALRSPARRCSPGSAWAKKACQPSHKTLLPRRSPSRQRSFGQSPWHSLSQEHERQSSLQFAFSSPKRR